MKLKPEIRNQMTVILYECESNYDVAIKRILNEVDMEPETISFLIHLGLTDLLISINSSNNKKVKNEAAGKLMPPAKSSKKNRVTMVAAGNQSFLYRRVYFGSGYKLLKDCNKEELLLATNFHRTLATGHMVNSRFFSFIANGLNGSIVSEVYNELQLQKLYKQAEESL